MRLNRRALMAGAGAAVLAPHVARAQSAWPQKSIRMIVPFAAGGGTDVLGRMVARALSERLGQQVYVENRGGANGGIGLQAVAQAEPDGYTIAGTSDTTLTVNPWLYDKLPYDPVRDFVAVHGVAKIPGMLVVHPSVPAKSVAELIALAKAKPGELAYSTGGIGNFGHLAAELFASATGVKMLPVHFRGTAPATLAVLAGDAQLTFINIQLMLEQVRAGKAVALGVNGLTRIPYLPDIPAVAETVPGFEVTPWVGVFAPVKTPQDVVDRLAREMAEIMRDPKFIASLGEQHFAAMPIDGKGLGDVVRRDTAKWEKVVKTAGIRGE